MNRNALKKQETIKRHEIIYKRIIELTPEKTVKEICKKLFISESTYYRIIRYYKDLSKTKKKYYGGNIESINETNISNNINVCPYDDKCTLLDKCPFVTNIKISTNDPIYAEFYTTHQALHQEYIIIND